jgi:hypothetical protein
VTILAYTLCLVVLLLDNKHTSTDFGYSRLLLAYSNSINANGIGTPARSDYTQD